MSTSRQPPNAEDPLPPQRDARSQRILSAAATLLLRWGYRKTTIDDVAREAGVSKGTIYLHWKDKNDLFRAAILHEQQQVITEMMRRIAADPEGGLPHRLWAHSILASLDNPLIAAIFRGNTDIFQGLRGAFDAATLQQFQRDYAAYITQLQGAGLMRADLPVPVITFLTSALHIGIVASPDIYGSEHMPAMEPLTDAISDLIRRWLEPEHPPADTSIGKQFAAEWTARIKDVEEHLS